MFLAPLIDLSINVNWISDTLEYDPNFEHGEFRKHLGDWKVMLKRYNEEIRSKKTKEERDVVLHTYQQVNVIKFCTSLMTMHFKSRTWLKQHSNLIVSHRWIILQFSYALVDLKNDDCAGSFCPFSNVQFTQYVLLYWGFYLFLVFYMRVRHLIMNFLCRFICFQAMTSSKKLLLYTMPIMSISGKDSLENFNHLFTLQCKLLVLSSTGSTLKTWVKE